jgi:hypothetical protein
MSYSVCSTSLKTSPGASQTALPPHRSNRTAQSNAASGLFHCSRRRLCTTLPLAITMTPRSRNEARLLPSSRWYWRGFSALIDSCTTGTSACGYMCARTLHVPWSRPHWSKSRPHHVGLTASMISWQCRALPEPDTETRTETAEIHRSRGSRVGLGMAVTAVAPKNQCAETTSTTFGRGSCRPSCRKRW